MTQEEVDTVGKHRPGSIKRIKLINFLTHGDVEFWPGPRLNMVIGANGTGKSTLLNAICLGLGGDPKLLGRADDLRAFIMHGKDKAEIEIELEPLADQPKHIFRRMIDRHRGSEKGRGRGASTFYINDEKTNIQAVKELVKDTYNIQIDNLCTFLPQDKVGNFSGFSDQDRLLETEKTLPSNQYFYKIHQQLIEKESSMESDITNVQSIRDTLQKKQHEFERLEVGKAREEERAQAEAQVDLLQKKRVWLQFELLRSEGQQLRDEREALKEQLQEANKMIAPLEDKHQHLESMKKELDAQHKALSQNIQRATKELDKQKEKYENHDDNLEANFTDLTQIETTRANNVTKLKEAEKRLENLLETQKTLQDKAQCEAELRDAKEGLRAARKSFEAARREDRNAKSSFRELDEQARQLQNKLAKMNDHAEQRKQHVFRSQRNVAQAAQWIEQNRDKFRRPVWGPIAVEVVTKSNNTAAYLEFHVPNNILKSFVCETEEDRKLLFSELRERQGIPVNVINVEGKNLEQQRIYSEQKMKILKKEHGVQCYLDQTFTAPNPVMIALQIWGSVHKVLVGDEKTQDSIDNKKLKDYLSEPDSALGQQGLQKSCIFAAQTNKSYRHTQSSSRYSGKIGSRVDEVGPARLLAPGVIPTQKKKVEDDLNAAHDEIRQLRPTLLQVEKNVKELEAHAQQCELEAKGKKSELEYLQKFDRKLDSARRRVKEAQDALEGDDTDEKKALVKEILRRVKNGIAAISAHGQQQDLLMRHNLAIAGIRVNQTAASTAERVARQALDEKKEEFATLKEKAVRASEKFKELRTKMHAKKKEAETLAPILDEDGNPTALKKKLEELQVDDVHEIEASLEEAERLLNQYDANPEVVRQYEKLKDEIELINSQLEDSTDARERSLRSIDGMRKDWEQRLVKHIDKINELFTVYMSEMGCTGEVRLTKGPAQEDGQEQRANFKLWGIEILVSFREGTKAQVLSAQRHSGGERSVSTILYLMALQDLMVAPFRCVDEINQGLDDRNERLVFKRIVANSTREPHNSPTDHSGQYWLITPKLLPNLNDMEEDAITILIVTNGPGNLKRNSDYNKLMLKGDTPSLVNEAEYDDENSDNIPRRKSKKSRLS